MIRQRVHLRTPALAYLVRLITLVLGLAYGTAVWSTSLVQLPLLGVAPPPWRQSPRSLAPDLGMHLVYGLSTAAVYGALSA